MELVLVRHGLPLSTEPAAGPPDPALSPTGHEQAARLAQWLSEERLDVVYSSPLARARQTAEPVAAVFGLPVVVEAEVQEIHFGEESYTPMEQIAADDPRAAMFRSAIADDDSELITSFRARIRAVMHDLIGRHPGESVLVACHGGVVNAALAEVLALTRTFSFDVGYTSVTRIRAGRTGRMSVRSVNDLGHLHAGTRR